MIKEVSAAAVGVLRVTSVVVVRGNINGRSCLLELERGYCLLLLSFYKFIIDLVVELLVSILLLHLLIAVAEALLLTHEGFEGRIALLSVLLLLLLLLLLMLHHHSFSLVARR